MLTQQMDVSFDRHLLACGVLEVRWHPRGHDDVRMEADEHEQAVGLRQPPGLSVQRGQVGQVLVDKAHGDEVVSAGLEATLGDVGLGSRPRGLGRLLGGNYTDRFGDGSGPFSVYFQSQSHIRREARIQHSSSPKLRA